MHEVFIKGKDVTYVNTAGLVKRQQYNKVILEIISEINNKVADQRFQQLLTNTGISSMEDLFHEESKRTLDLLLSNPYVNRFFRKYEVKKAEVLDFNELRNKKG